MLIAIGIVALICLLCYNFIGNSTDEVLNKPSAEKSMTVHSAKQRKSTNAHSSSKYLPKSYSDKLTQQSEISVKKKLEQQLNQFRRMSENMRREADKYLIKIESRRLPSGVSKDANNTSAARSIQKVADNGATDMSVRQIYQLMKEYEKEIHQNHIASSAAKLALKNGLSFPEVYNSMDKAVLSMPEYNSLVNDSLFLKEGFADGKSISNIEELNGYRALMDNAMRQAALAGSRLQRLFGTQLGYGISKSSSKVTGYTSSRTQGDGDNGTGSKSGANGGRKGGYGNGISFGSGASSGEGTANSGDGGNPATQMGTYAGQTLDPNMVKAQALPGRRFSKSASRKGWLYVNTWYMIGPWENYGRDDFAMVHPPEIAVDFDAVYHDGQRGEGIEETDADPIKMIGRKVRLDGTLRWKFMQSESMHNVMPVTTSHSTYYAYTELFFDEPCTMSVAIGTDDSGRVWINGKDVWKDTGTSWYKIDEHITKFHFRQGWNTVLVRLENGGGGPAGFSFLILPLN